MPPVPRRHPGKIDVFVSYVLARSEIEEISVPKQWIRDKNDPTNKHFVNIVKAVPVGLD